MTELNTEERTECEIWTRVMGYHRPMAWFNAGKKAEFAERKWFNESNCCGKIQRIDQLLRASKNDISFEHEIIEQPDSCAPRLNWSCGISNSKNASGFLRDGGLALTGTTSAAGESGRI
jgi:hypothetical protein